MTLLPGHKIRTRPKRDPNRVFPDSSNPNVRGDTRMAKIAVILLADTDRPEGMGRMANALTTAEEAKDAGDEIRVILDGAGTKWGAELADESHKYHRLLSDLKAETGALC